MFLYKRIMFDSCFRDVRPTELFHVDFDGEPIYRSSPQHNIVQGHAFFISAQLFPRGDLFTVDFCMENSQRDIALRLGFRVSTGTMRRSSRIKNKWLKEETCLANWLPIVCGKTFELEVCFSKKYIHIAIDGIHLANYKHHQPFNGISIIEIRGDVMNIVVERKASGVYPLEFKRLHNLEKRYLGAVGGEVSDVEDNESVAEAVAEAVAGPSGGKAALSLPYYAKFTMDDFKQDDRLVVEGYVTLNPHSFKIALQDDQHIWPQPNVAVQVGFYFCELYNSDETDGPVIVVKSFADKKWSDGIRNELEPRLCSMLGFFTLTITRGETAFDIHFCNNFICSYPYVESPVIANTCVIQGDLKLIAVHLEIH